MTEQQSTYLGLARKWRSQTFEDLVGQEHVTRTLVNAIRSGRISHSYLFTGTRGVGKTSAARILSKALRCEPSKFSGVPCNVCQDCLDITSGKSIDVLEIDGASNNGVDAVRELRENAKFLPSTGKYKIYIIDEVHMLTTAAFNALLKTLEEPPQHLIFILATTDPQKIPTTVLGRCQRYDFKRVSLKSIISRLSYICEKEGLKIDDGALQILSREAEGSLRDAISLLDQVIAAGDAHITVDTLTKSLGLIDRKTLVDTLHAVLKRDALAALEAVGQVHLFGYDLKVFTKELLRTVRLLMVVQLLESKNVSVSLALEVTEADMLDLKPLVGLRSQDDLDMIFCVLNQGLEDLTRTTMPKIILDVMLMKVASAENLVAVENFSVEPTRLGSSEVKAPFMAAPVNAAPVAFSAPAQAAPVSRPSPASAFVPPPVLDVTLRAGVQVPPASTPSTEATGVAVSAASWPEIVKKLKAQKPFLGNILENATFENFSKADGTNSVLTIGFSKEQSFFKDQLQLKANQEALSTFLKTQYGTNIRVECKDVAVTRSIEDDDRTRKEAIRKEKHKAVMESEAMRAAQEVLGARIERLEITGDQP